MPVGRRRFVEGPSAVPGPESSSRCLNSPRLLLSVGLVGERGLPRRFEFVAGHPGRRLVGVGDLAYDLEAQLGVFYHTLEVPLRPELVARLMVPVRLIVENVLFPPSFRFANEVRS